MTAEQVLINNGYTPIDYSDIIFKDTYIGAASKERNSTGGPKSVCLLIEDNIVDYTNNLDKCILDMDIVKEIAYTTDILYTNFGVSVHSHTMKTSKPFNTLKIVKISNY